MIPLDQQFDHFEIFLSDGNFDSNPLFACWRRTQLEQQAYERDVVGIYSSSEGISLIRIWVERWERRLPVQNVLEEWQRLVTRTPLLPGSQ